MTVLRLMHRLPKSSSSLNSPSRICRLFKSDGKLTFRLDKDALHRSLEAQGIEKYADTVASVMKEAAEDLTFELKLRVGKEYFEKYSVSKAALYYILGAGCFSLSTIRWSEMSLLSKKDA